MRLSLLIFAFLRSTSPSDQSTLAFLIFLQSAKQVVHSYWKKYLPGLVLPLLFFAYTGFQFELCAQTPEIDSLEQQLSGMPEDTDKVKTFKRIAYSHWARSDFEQAKNYYKEALSIATKLGDQAMMGDIYHRMSVVDWNKGDFQEALYNTNQALHIHLTINNKWRIGGGYLQIGNINKAQGNYSEALKYYLLALKIFEENNFQVDIGLAYTNIATIYIAQGNQKLALENFLASLKLFEDHGHKEGMMNNYTNLANIYGNLGEVDKALTYYSASLKLSQEAGNRYQTITTLLNIGRTYDADKQEYDKATPYYEDAMQLSREIADSISIARCYFCLGDNNTNLKNYDLARTYLAESISIYKTFGLKDKLRDAYKALAKLDTLSGNHQLALTHYKQYVTYRDSLNDEAHNKTITEMNVKFETEKKDKEILRLENEKEINALNLQVKNESLARMQFQRDKLNVQSLYQMERIDLLDKEKQLQQLELEKNQCDITAQQAEAQKKEDQLILLNQQGEIKDLQLKRKTQTQNYILSGFFLFALLGIYMYAHHRTRQKLKLQILKQKIAETEMMALRAQMNPHFIFNCINSIDALIQRNDKYRATLYLNKFAKLIRNILDSSKMSDMTIAKDLETLKLYIDLEQFRNENKFTADIHADPVLLQGDYKIPPLIIQPYVENSILHGIRNRPDNEGKLTVTLQKIDGYIQYTVEDNGVGRKNTLKDPSNEKKSYGMDMSSERIRLFNHEEYASVTITDLEVAGNPLGTRVDVLLKMV